MPLDTVKFKSPPMAPSDIRKIESICVRRQGVQVGTGELLYEITTGELRGSWDSRISIRPMWQDWVVNARGKPELRSCAPYLIVECSTAKVFFGQNIYGGPTDFQATCAKLVDFLETLLQINLPPALSWIVRRVDWAESFALLFRAMQEYFRQIHPIQFPRRKAQKYGDHAIYFPGKTTTVKFYNKGLEFSQHDKRRVRQALAVERTGRFPKLEFAPVATDGPTANEKWIRRRLAAFQRLANNRLRVEVEIHAEKLDYDLGHKPTVQDITDDYLIEVYDREVQRLLREGKAALQTVRLNLGVAERLRTFYGLTHGNHLHGFWCQMATSGEAECRKNYHRATFYRYRKQLMDAGVSWLNTDVQVIEPRGILPVDFSPIRSDPRRCIGRIRERSTLTLERDFVGLTA